VIYSTEPKPQLDKEAFPAGRFQQPGSRTAALSARPDPEQQALAQQIVARIETRLPSRIRHLTATATDNAIVLSGECSTFYTKQLAQHVAMGVLEYEKLINNISVQLAQ
jgi:hypothetical protein